MVHAGLWPSWTFDQASTYSSMLSHSLQTEPRSFLKRIWCNMPEHEQHVKNTEDQERFLSHVFTRMRALCQETGAINFSFKGCYADLDKHHLVAWFDVPDAHWKNETASLFFGHWSQLGLYLDEPKCVGLDTGAVWGHYLSIYQLEHHMIIQV
jgi:bis(5'-nucleosyl)-tetraphosphatase (symmetrical)